MNILETTVLFPSSGPNNAERLEHSRRDLEALGAEISVHWPRQVALRRAGDPTDYLAGTEAVRCEEIMEFLLSPQYRIGWFGRGGYGVTRALSLLDSTVRERGPIEAGKRWMGYSDITALFAFVKTRGLPVECIHGPMVCAFSKQPNQADLLRALRGEPCEIPFEAEGEVEFQGPIWGGNLAVLASLCGTPWLPVPEAGAVFLEDVDEAPYRVDRYITQLFDSGFFARTRSVILGTFTGFQPAEAVLSVARSRCRELGLKVLGRVPIGHSEPHSPLFLDRPYLLSGKKLVPCF